MGFSLYDDKLTGFRSRMFRVQKLQTFAQTSSVDQNGPERVLLLVKWIRGGDTEVNTGSGPVKIQYHQYCS